MPQYDESFILDDNANQRRNKRSYRVSKKGYYPGQESPTSATLDGHGTYVLKNNINNLKKNRDFGSHYTLKENGYAVENGLYSKSENKSFPSLLDEPYKRGNDKFIFSPDVYAAKNNNYYSFVAGKSLENLATHGFYSPLKNGNGLLFGHLRGKSLQNLNETSKTHQFLHNKNKKVLQHGVPSKNLKVKDTAAIVVNVNSRFKDNNNDKKGRRLYETNGKYKERPALKLTNRILESGVYRQLGRKGSCDENDDSGFAEDLNGVENTDAGGGSSGHKASFRGANKLARRARSFKEDLLERISAMRSPGAPSTHTALPSLRSQSPLSSKGRSQQKDDPESNPAKELETLVKQIKFELTYFCDVITKKKLEMLPGNGTIVLDTITNIQTIIRPYISQLGPSPSAKLDVACTRLCHALADLIRLCDKSMLDGESSSVLDKAHVQRTTEEVQKSVDDLTKIAFEEIAKNGNIHLKANGNAVKENKNLKLQPRPAVENVRISTNESQRNSLPDIPLTPHERKILENAGNGYKMRNSLSTESILDSVSPQEPPPKPPIPIRTFDVAPPLPPKRRPLDTSLLTATDRSSHSSESLDSVLNVSNDEEIRAIMDRNSTNFDDPLPITIDNLGTIGSINNRLSLESNSTIDTSLNMCGNNSNISNEMIPHSDHMNDVFINDSMNNQNNSQHRLSVESGFISMGNTRHSEISNSSFNSTLTQHQKSSLSYIDSTPTPNEFPQSLMVDFNADKCQMFSMSSNKMLDVASVANIVHHSMKQMSSNNFFEQNTKTCSSSESKVFNHSSVLNANNMMDIQKSSVKLETAMQSFSQKNSSQVMMIDKNTITSKSSSNIINSAAFSSSSTEFLKTGSENSIVSTDSCDASQIPPALPVKTRKQGRLQNDIFDHCTTPITTTIDDQIVELRDRVVTCAIHGHPDGLMQRPHTLMDQSLGSGQPPPLPMKKKHMFQSVAYSVMAYMEMFGNCNHSPQNSTEFLRHSVHTYNAEHQHAANHFAASSQFQQFNNASFGLTAQNGQTITSIGCNQQLTQSHTLQHFTISSNSLNSTQQNISGFSSPLRSPHFVREDSIKSDASSVNSLSTNSSNLPNNSVILSLPPALPPKKTKIRQTPSQSPAKPPLSPKPPTVINTGTSSPTTPAPLACTTPNGRTSISPAPRFQFDPAPVTLDNALLLNADDEQWQQNTNKPGKFPVEDLDLEQKTNISSSPSSRDAEPSLETETENEHIILEMDVSSRLVLKRPGEDGPEIRGGHPEALIVHAIKSTKDFSYQEAFLTTYRTFVPPLDLIQKLNRRHEFLVRHGKHTKAREVQALLTRIVGDLTMADLDDQQLITIIMDFVYGLVCSGDLAMAKALRVTILEKYKAKQLMLQLHQMSIVGGQWMTATARRDSILEYKAESIAEQMTLLDTELFTRIPAPEALLWARDQCEERSPNLTKFTEHFNKMSYWARSRILDQEEAKEREKYISKFIKVMKHLRKMNNFNSYLALLSALDSAPIRRLDWPKQITDGLKEYCALIDSSSSFRAYRQALAETQPPCIPYIGLVLQDLTFVHIGNSDLLPDGSINFSKRWQQYHILENMKRFSKAQYTFKKNERIIAMFNSFDDFLNEETMWQISEGIKPRGGKKNTSST